MIVAETPRGWRCVTQPDHARLSHDILALWRADGLPRHPRRDALLLAVREHDNGWQQTDAAPRLDPRGNRPLDFTDLAAADRLEVWQRGIARYRSEQPYVAALIAEHARHLHQGRPAPSPEWAQFQAHLPTARDEALAVVGIDLDTLLEDYRWLHLADLVSLAACAGWEGPFERWGRTGTLSGATVTLAPFPLAGATAFAVACRYLPAVPYGSDAAMATALAGCRWERWTVRIAP